MSTCTRWWHCACRLTPSLATSPVMSTRTGDCSQLEVLDDLALLGRRRGRRAGPRTASSGSLEPLREPLGEPVERRDPLGEQDDPGVAALRRPRSSSDARRARCSLADAGRGRQREVGEAIEGGAFARGAVRVLASRFWRFVDGLEQGSGRGEERLGQRPREQLRRPARRWASAVGGWSQRRGQLVGDGVLGGRWPGRRAPAGSGRSAQLVPDLCRDRGASGGGGG